MMGTKFQKKIIKINGNSYEAHKLLGQGQYGLIYAAHSRGKKADGTKIPTEVAIKEYFYTRFRDQDGHNFCEEYWNREVETTRIQGQAPNAHLKLLDYGKSVDNTHQEYYIVIDLIDGKTIKDWFMDNFGKKPQLNNTEIIQIIKEILIPIAHHLQYCHEHGVIHRDLSIDNILIMQPHRKMYVPVIIDWGAAKRRNPQDLLNPKKPYFDSNARSSTAFMNRGTPPEVILGLEPVIASDVYMFGHLMYFLLSGGKTCRTPAVKEDYILHPCSENVSCPHEYDQLVEKCTQYEPADRVKSMEIIIHILEKMVNNISPDQITGFSKPETPIPKLISSGPKGPVIQLKKGQPVPATPIFQGITPSPDLSSANLPPRTPQPAVVSPNPSFSAPYVPPVSNESAPKESKPLSSPSIVMQNLPQIVPNSSVPNASILPSIPPPTVTPFQIDSRTQQFAQAFKKYFDDPTWASHKQDTVQIYYTFFQGFLKGIKSHSPLISVQRASGNVYYVGEILGSLDDLRHILLYFGKVIEKVPNTRIVFLGHYFHQMHQDLETFTYLLAYKSIYPENIVLLRSATEERSYLDTVGFLNHIQKRFDKYAPYIIDQISEILANLDILNIIENENGIRMLASSGGIPFLYRTPDKILNLTTLEPYLNPRQFFRNQLDEITQCILWGRPNELNDTINADSQGHIFFSWTILQKFFLTNNLRYMFIADNGAHGGYRTIWNQISAIHSTSINLLQNKTDSKIVRVNAYGMSELLVKDLPFYLERDYEIK